MRAKAAIESVARTAKTSSSPEILLPGEQVALDRSIAELVQTKRS